MLPPAPPAPIAPSRDRFPLTGDEKGMGWNAPAAPATVSGEPSAITPLGSKPEKAADRPRPASQETCPSRVVFRPVRVCRTDGDIPRATTAPWRARSAGGVARGDMSR
ncbi:hypothetical protein SP6_46_00390 [Sphingomonas paucimobilis NBRC 13935]|uniref:DNA, contig: SP646 n=1 Tax=Sphingomonas paucimobilis NBRC 13935 TaxID=1219050 RepID=A0A0C9N5U7_SPHPI|nr:hypothetical protein SP6_46_00390 [Sphingomonas paucimobilis NBRC 13935]